MKGLGNIKTLIGRKMGPLPLGAWIIVLAGGMLIAYFINKRTGGIGGGGSSDDSESESDSGFSSDSDSDYGENITGGLLGSQGAASNPSLGGVIVVNPNPAQTGSPVSLPPVRVAQPPSVRKPALTAPRKDSRGSGGSGGSGAGGGGKVYTVKHGDNLWALAQRFYGDGSQWHRILAANPKIKANNRYGYMIYSGTKLRIP